MSPTLREAVARFGDKAKTKLANVAAVGEPEEQLRAPLERLIGDLAELCSVSRGDVAAVGESRLAELHTRPDYAITVKNALTGFIEVKARERAQIRASSGTATTNASGRSCGHCRTLSTPTGTSSACGTTGISKDQSCASPETSRFPGPILTRRRRYSTFSRDSSSGSRFRRATRGNWLMGARGCAGYCAMR